MGWGTIPTAVTSLLWWKTRLYTRVNILDLWATVKPLHPFFQLNPLPQTCSDNPRLDAEQSFPGIRCQSLTLITFNYMHLRMKSNIFKLTLSPRRWRSKWCIIVNTASARAFYRTIATLLAVPSKMTTSQFKQYIFRAFPRLEGSFTRSEKF